MQKGDNLVMPTSASLENLRALRDALHDERTRRVGGACSTANVLQQQPVVQPQIPSSPSSGSQSTQGQPDITQDVMHKVGMSLKLKINVV